MDGDTSLDGGTASFLEGKLMDLTECLRDSPGFRVQLYEQERQISDLETRLDKVVLGCEKMVEASLQYTEAARGFTNSFKELSEHFKDNNVVANAMRQFCDVLPKLHSLYSVLCEQAHVTIQKSLKTFLSGNLSKVKETKKTFHKISDDLNTAINRSAHTPKTKPLEAEEASAALANMEMQFSHHAIDYGYQVNTIHCEKGHEIVHNLLTYMRAQSSFFNHGYDLLKESDPFIGQLSSSAEAMKKECSAEMEKMSKRHSLVVTQHLQDISPDEPLLPLDNPAVPIEISGYLFKKGSSGFKSWSRRYFVLKDYKLVYHSRSKAENDSDYLKTYVTVADDLRICTVKYAEDLERRFCFEVVTPNKSCMLQADSDAQRKKWVAYLEAGVARALRISISAKGERGSSRNSVIYGDRDSPLFRNRADSDGPTALAKDYSLGLNFLEVPGNDKCADCSSPRPNWASINLGIMVCIKCSGIHRSLGVHITKVRSVTLDDWEPEVQKIMCALGNARVNAIYEYIVPDYIKRPTPTSIRAERETFIKAKYVDHAFVHPHPDFIRREVPRPTPRRPVSPRFPSQFPRPISSTSLEGLDESKSMCLSETSSLSSSVDPTLLLMAQNLSRVQGYGGDKPRARSTSNLFAKFGGKIMNKAKGWKASLQERSPVIGRKDAMGGGREECERTVVEEDVVVTNHLPLNKESDDLECKSVSISLPVQNVPSTPSAGIAPSPLLVGKFPSPRSSPPPPPKPPRTYKVRRSMSGRARIDFPEGSRQVSKPAASPEGGGGGSTNNVGQEGKVAVVCAVEGVAAARVTEGALPANQEMTQHVQDASVSRPVGHTPTEAEAMPHIGSLQNPSSHAFSNGRHGVVYTGAIPEEGFEEAREMKVAFRDPSTLKRSASLTDHRFSVLSEEWFSPNESDDEEDDDDDDDEKRLRLPLVDEDHFSTPPTSPESSPVKEMYRGDGDDGGIMIVAHPEAEEKSTPPFFSYDQVITRPIPILLLPKDDHLIAKPVPILQQLPKEGGVPSPLKEGGVPLPPKEGSKEIPSPPKEVPLPPKEGSKEIPSPPKEVQLPPKEGSKEIPSPPKEVPSPPKEVPSPPKEVPSPPKEVPSPPKEVPSPPKEGSHEVPSPPKKALSPPKEGNKEVPSPPKDEHSSSVQQPTTSDRPHHSTAQVAVISPLPRERTNAPPVQSPKTKRASVQPIPQASPIAKRPSIQVSSPIPRELPTDTDQKPPSTPTINHFRTSPLSVEQSAKRIQGVEVGVAQRKVGVAPAAGQLSSVSAASVTKLSDSEDVFEDKAILPPSGGNQSDTASLISSFSVQDLQDIFKGHIPVPTLRIHSVDDSMLPNGSTFPDMSDRAPEGNGFNSRLSQSTMDMTSLDGECVGNGLERSPSVGTQPPEVEMVVIPDSVHPDVFLFDAATKGNVPAALCALAHGANVNYVSLENDCRTALLEAVDTGNVTMTEFLYQNGGKLDVCDMSMKRGCLHHAVLKDDPSMVVLLLKKGGPVSNIDVDGKDALALALEKENVNIVMLLKVTKFKSDYQKKNDDPHLEETVAEVYKDIEVVTTNEPERLKKLNGSDNHSIISHDSK